MEQRGMLTPNETAPGQPKTTLGAGSTGATMSVRPSPARTTVPTPGVNSAPAGRPPLPPSPTPVGRVASVFGLTPKPQPVPDQLSRPAAPTQPVEAAAPVAAAPAPMTQNFSGHPTANQLKRLPPGAQGMTPWGPASLDANGKVQINFTPEGAAAYQAAKADAVKKFGPVPIKLAGAPEPPVVPGQPSFNPFTNSWSR